MPEIRLTGDQVKLLLSIANRGPRALTEIPAAEIPDAWSLWEQRLLDAAAGTRLLHATPAGRAALEAI